MATLQVPRMSRLPAVAEESSEEGRRRASVKNNSGSVLPMPPALAGRRTPVSSPTGLEKHLPKQAKLQEQELDLLRLLERRQRHIDEQHKLYDRVEDDQVSSARMLVFTLHQRLCSKCDFQLSLCAGAVQSATAQT